MKPYAAVNALILFSCESLLTIMFTLKMCYVVFGSFGDIWWQTFRLPLYTGLHSSFLQHVNSYGAPQGHTGNRSDGNLISET